VVLTDLPECFGREYFDDAGGECPHMDCLLRYDCNQVFSAAHGLRSVAHEAKSKPTASPPQSGVPVKRKRGYVKPGRLLYKDEGTLRDSFLHEIREYLEKFNFQLRATKCLHSFSNSKGVFVLKIDTRRKNSILLYVSDDLHEELLNEGFISRRLFSSEAPNFPPYLSWVVVVRSLADLDKFKKSFEGFQEGEDDTE